MLNNEAYQMWDIMDHVLSNLLQIDDAAICILVWDAVENCRLNYGDDWLSPKVLASLESAYGEYYDKEKR